METLGPALRLWDMQWEGDSPKLECRRLKTNQIRDGGAVTLHCSGEGDLCPVQAHVAHPPDEGSLFLHGGLFLPNLILLGGVFRKGLSFLGLPQTRYPLIRYKAAAAAP